MPEGSSVLPLIENLSLRRIMALRHPGPPWTSGMERTWAKCHPAGSHHFREITFSPRKKLTSDSLHLAHSLSYISLTITLLRVV